MKLRDRFLSAKTRIEKTTTVQLPGDDGVLVPIEVLLVSPTVRQRNAILGEVSTTDKGGVSPTRTSNMMAQAVIQCVLDPETRTPVFEATDADLLLDCPAGGWLDLLATQVMALMDDTDRKARDDFPPSAPNSDSP